MKLSKNLKQEVFSKLHALLDSKMLDVKRAIEDILESRESETKSSAGDKFETGREMMQIEIGKYQDQLEKYLKQKKAISQIDTEKKHELVGIGSMVKTTQGIYMVSVGLGPVEVSGVKYFAISLASPIGQLLEGLRQGDKVKFQNKEIEILEIQ
jgi:transcription elongation GreA/GreB family factor